MDPVGAIGIAFQAIHVITLRNSVVQLARPVSRDGSPDADLMEKSEYLSQLSGDLETYLGSYKAPLGAVDSLAGDSREEDMLGFLILQPFSFSFFLLLPPSSVLLSSLSVLSPFRFPFPFFFALSFIFPSLAFFFIFLTFDLLTVVFGLLGCSSFICLFHLLSCFLIVFSCSPFPLTLAGYVPG
ncbi:hypothetical protein N657DRAFT_42883 [Parathielavia appendiculata]|uniref:Uncharacterized protein n=1 Tax=Parathielavia appendiculata TaxID=2587402 RepID=A0AAN6U995_9PEZI|nr:hypothetical protein N657DRAFT_42883 [Parathielavia appendiculata]